MAQRGLIQPLQLMVAGNAQLFPRLRPKEPRQGIWVNLRLG